MKQMFHHSGIHFPRHTSKHGLLGLPEIIQCLQWYCYERL